MTQKDLIKQLEKIKQYIHNECGENLYDTSAANHLAYEKFENASLALFYNALYLYHNQPPTIITSQNPLTLTDTEELLFKIYQTLVSTDFVDIKENKIRQYIKSFNINPDDILTTNPEYEDEEVKIKNLLSGAL